MGTGRVPNRFKLLLISMGNRGLPRSLRSRTSFFRGVALLPVAALRLSLRSFFPLRCSGFLEGGPEETFFQWLESSNVWKTHLPRRVDARRPPGRATQEKPSATGSGGGVGGV